LTILNSVLNYLQAEVDRGAADINEAIEGIILAANGACIARSTGSNTNDGNGRTPKTDRNIDTAEDDAQDTEKAGNQTIAG